ncbi:PilX N-terminal [Thermoanaerobacter thermohydrosulfuricus]|uniref:PilX N-terminal n=1 Tax=Thermoanaerobacter thermohydrosulfuricus TaxID=1516 RepID=A0A1G7HES6_THETY|nr:pilus assembly PilX N-terminal domain-containing protein [Thermoanaerobacter thermohydrosulfuricus]SDE98803.1 PilX N-terminal [Thermoanaerobacter thermohydrosulfuricus]SFE70599.1 PilX N-terminal [Thermoanaerobacter thermohydrosulfuricus]
MFNERGSALIFTLMVILILTVLAVAILEVTITNYKISHAYANSISATYAAEAGLERVKNEFNIALLDAYQGKGKGKGKGEFWINVVENKNTTKIQYKQDAKNLLKESFGLDIPVGEWISLGDSGQEYKIDSIEMVPPSIKAFENEGTQVLTYKVCAWTEGRMNKIVRYGYAEITFNINVNITKMGDDKSANYKVILSGNASQSPPIVDKWIIDSIPQTQ